MNELKFIRANYGYGIKEDWKEIELFMEIDKFHEIKELLKKQ